VRGGRDNPDYQRALDDRANPRHRPDAGLAIVVTQGNCSTTTSVYRQLIA
jgi:hypothetical protein